MSLRATGFNDTIPRVGGGAKELRFGGRLLCKGQGLAVAVP